MPAERNAPTRPSREDADARQETLSADAFRPGTSDHDGAGALIETHRRAAARLLADNQPTRAFGELVRASRAVPMTPRLAALLVSFSLRASAEPAAVTLLQSGLDVAEGAHAVAIRRQLVRLFRRLGELERARESLVLLLASAPDDARARRVLNALLETEQRWDELDASLEKEANEALKHGSRRRAARAMLQRARACEGLGNHARAALRYQQAADLLEAEGDPHAAFDLRLLWLRALREASAPRRALDEAVERFLASGSACGKSDRARAALSALGLLPGATSASSRGRLETQRELLAAAEEAEAGGRSSEASALLRAALEEAPDPAALRRLEAHYIARRAWRELAQFYRGRLAQTSEPEARADLLSRLAEVLEDELGDEAGAAQAYEEIVRLTGDDAALREQVRLLSARKDQSGVRRAYESAVRGAGSRTSRSKALTARAEAALRKKEFHRARADFDAALEVDDHNLAAHAGRAEAAARSRDLAPIRAFADALRAAPRRFAGRVELCRRLAVLADKPLGELPLAKWAWTEVLAEAPDDVAAVEALAELGRRTTDDFTLEDALRRLISHEPRGPKARKARLDLVALFERNGRGPDALDALREATTFEPGHKEAWLLLADRLIQLGDNAQCAWALEQAATSTEDDEERMRTWARLARFTREVVGDVQQALVFERRANNLRELTGSRQALPPPEEERTRTEEVAVADPSAAQTLFELPAVAPDELSQALAGREADDFSGAALEPLEVPWEDPVPQVEDILEVTTGDLLLADEVASADRAPVEDWDAPPGRIESGPHTVELPVPLGDSHVSATPSVPTPMVSRLREQRTRLLERVRGAPLEAEGYHALAQYFDDLGDAARSGLMAEIGAALDGDPHAAPLPPRLILAATDRAGLRHPYLRGEEGELLALAGIALCRTFPARGRDAGSREEFRVDAGRGAAPSAEALLASVRILGLRAPDVFLAEDNGPPFSLAFTAQGVRLLVGRLAVKKELPAGELRFFAGRALFTQNPDLLALRTLKKDQILRGLSILAQVVKGGHQLSAEGRALKEGIAPKAIARLRELLQSVPRELPLQRLVEGSRHSANRAGLVVAGAVAPALSALKAKKALQSEVLELVRFAASERYLQLRTRRLG